MIHWIGGFLLLGLALLIALPALADLAAWLVGRARAQAPRVDESQRLLFLVPAHNEELLIGRCVRSLLGQGYPAELLKVLVVADNCSDGTPALAKEAGATVLERTDPESAGKGHAIEWALAQVSTEQFAAVVIIDADTVVEPDFSRALMRWAPLESRVMQAYDGASNEFENWLTRLSGLLTRNRYDIALPIKARAMLSCPLTGDGVVIGSGILAKHPWRVVTITEGWELYARLTLGGVRIDYAAEAVLYAQESASLSQSSSQRARWTAGRMSVLQLYLTPILTRPGVGLLQRADLLAELTNPGPVVRGLLGLIGSASGLALGGSMGWAIAGLSFSGIAQPVLYSIISLRRHPQPRATVYALLWLPSYALWRAWVGVKAMGQIGSRAWTRTHRHEET